MTYIHLFKLLEEASMSPEQLGERLGIAGITIRRWTEHPKNEQLPLLYEKAVSTLVLEMIAEGRISADSEIAAYILRKGSDHIYFAATRTLGLSEDFLKNADQSPESLIEGITKMGSDQRKQAIVDKNKKKIMAHRRLGKDWRSRLQILWNATISKDLSKFEKFVAYGALFYLLAPFDLIPDHIPVFGLMDDYVILGLAMAYYLKRFPRLFKLA